jgi:hypothetical protein
VEVELLKKVMSKIAWPKCNSATLQIEMLGLKANGSVSTIRYGIWKARVLVGGTQVELRFKRESEDPRSEWNIRDEKGEEEQCAIMTNFLVAIR